MQSEIYFDNDQEDIPRTVRRRKKQLYESIRERMEFYFSDSNLQKDRFLSKLIQEDPHVDLSIFLNFNKIRQLTTSLHDLKKALKKSEFLELTEDKSKVFRKTPIKEKANVDACTIYVEQLSCDVDHEWIKQIFSRYGKVDYVSIPKYKNSGKIKGFAFVEFESPEVAKAALDEFEREGCCLTNQMNPEKLCSIATFEDDKFEGKNQLNQPANDKSVKSQQGQMKVVENDSESRRATKRKLKESADEDDEVGHTDKKSKKMNSEESDNSKNGIECKDESNAEEEMKPDKDEGESQDESKNASGEVEVPTKKKKNRKKKKSLKMKYVNDIKMYGLQILSKADWKKLRNKYLNIQKEKMKKLKQHIYKSHMHDAFKQQQQQQQQQVTNQVIEPQTQPRFTFSKGAIIKVMFDEPLKDSSQVNQFKCEAKSLRKVEYVDVDVGSKEGYIRFQDSDTVQDVIQSKPWESMSVLEGEEEEQYWEKMKRDRCEKFENKKKFKKKRGRNKIIDKTEKLISKKIRLSVDE